MLSLPDLSDSDASPPVPVTMRTCAGTTSKHGGNTNAMTEPDFDPHREGKRGCLIGAAAALVVIIGLIWLLG